MEPSSSINSVHQFGGVVPRETVVVNRLTNIMTEINPIAALFLVFNTSHTTILCYSGIHRIKFKMRALKVIPLGFKNLKPIIVKTIPDSRAREK